ncbi:MAG: hypothetical protein KC501_21700 [Myxococcales bacterium]|nr:hypothetical protein [Myxococcales bacterium]
MYRWKPTEVDATLDDALAKGQRDAELLALTVAREVYPKTPEGPAQPWPPTAGDARGHCILDRIRIRVNLRLAELADDAADDDGPGGSDPFDGPLPEPPPTKPPPPGPADPTPPSPVPPGPSGPTLEPPHRPEPPPVDVPDEPPPDPGNEWPDYPPPAPVDLAKWTDPGNYPTPGKFHQVGGPNSATTLQAIARKALTTAFYLVHGDLELAKELALRSENWRAYREAIECSAWNHALYGSHGQPGTSGYYETPHGDTISMYPAHANIASLLANGEPPERRVRLDDPKLPPGGRHALLWLPPLDEAELLQGRVKVKHAHWWTGDWMIMPPPEVLALGVAEVPPGTWGCGGYETEYAYDEEDE